jgi:FAD/FMN-containing dehydrogenase
VAKSGQVIARALNKVLGDHRVVTEPRRLAQYRGIAWGDPVSKVPLSRPLAPPLVAALPRSTEDVLAVVRVARETGTPIVPYGAGTGVHAGAAPVEGSILLDLGAMRRVVSVSQDDRMARVEPGVILGALDREAATHGLMVGHDPWSQPIASVGGAVSTNGVGYLAGKYGSMGDQVVALEAVLGTGEVVRTRAVPKSSTGPTLRHLFIGAEGVLGVITEIDLRLFPIPELRALAGFRFPRFEAGLHAVMEMASVQLRPSMLDYEEDDPSPGQLQLGRLVDLPSLMFLAFEGFREEVEAQLARASRICRQCGGETMPPDEPQEFWDARHESAERYLRQRELDPEGRMWRQQRRWWSSTYVNVGLPVSAIQPFRERAARELAGHRLALKASGLWGMPELFSLRFEHQEPEDARAGEELEEGTDLGLRIAQDLGGSMEYCHGVGLRLAHLMDFELGTGLEVLRRLKAALDPDGLLNPGKLAL